MKRGLSPIALAGAGMAVVCLTAAVAAQAQIPFPAVSRPVCESYGGVFSSVSGTPPTRTCVVASVEYDLPASHPQQDWVVDVEEITIYTKTGGTETTDGTYMTVTACRNHQGNNIGGFESNPNCQPS
jgi:hypothetical protein